MTGYVKQNTRKCSISQVTFRTVKVLVGIMAVIDITACLIVLFG